MPALALLSPGKSAAESNLVQASQIWLNGIAVIAFADCPAFQKWRIRRIGALDGRATGRKYTSSTG
jgi:hypothetical protein